MRILVVDDDDAIGNGIGRALVGHDVVIERDAEAALAVIAADRSIAIVLCDLHLPRMTGTELFLATRQLLGERAPLLVLMTGSMEAVRSVADLTLRKPFGLNALRALPAAWEQLQAERGEIPPIIPLPIAS